MLFRSICVEKRRRADGRTPSLYLHHLQAMTMASHGVARQASDGSVASKDVEKQDASLTEDVKEVEEVLSTYVPDPEAERR